MILKIRIPHFFLGLAFITYSCCIGAKEEFLGNNLYLSEYDNIDRRIIYNEEKCSVSGTEIIPMTVSEYAYNSQWIIAKTYSRYDTIVQYWIIRNSYDLPPVVDTIKANTIGPLNIEDFKKILKKNRINLVLKTIDNN